MKRLLIAILALSALQADVFSMKRGRQSRRLAGEAVESTGLSDERRPKAKKAPKVVHFAEEVEDVVQPAGAFSDAERAEMDAWLDEVLADEEAARLAQAPKNTHVVFEDGEGYDPEYVTPLMAEIRAEDALLAQQWADLEEARLAQEALDVAVEVHPLSVAALGRDAFDIRPKTVASVMDAEEAALAAERELKAQEEALRQARSKAKAAAEAKKLAQAQAQAERETIAAIRAREEANKAETAVAQELKKQSKVLAAQRARMQAEKAAQELAALSKPATIADIVRPLEMEAGRLAIEIEKLDAQLIPATGAQLPLFSLLSAAYNKFRGTAATRAEKLAQLNAIRAQIADLMRTDMPA